MKRSAFMIDVNRAVVTNADWLELARIACKGDLGFFGELAAQKAEEAGVTWDPEEPELPELPERLLLHLTRGLCVPDSAGVGAHYSRNASIRELAEAAACYNLLREIMGPNYRYNCFTTEHLRQLLKYYRESLQ